MAVRWWYSEQLFIIYYYKMFENVQLRGLISVMGAFLISLSVGIMYLWGIITIYGTSYFRIVTKNGLLT